MCALDFEPFLLTEKKGFNIFCENHQIGPLPSAKNVSDTALTDLYVFFKKKTVDLIEKAPKHISITLDCWTDSYKRRAFIVYRVHFYLNNMVNVLTLKTALFPHPHTARSIRDDFELTVNDFNLQNKKITAVTDSGSNIVAALKLAGVKRLPCAAHSLHLFLSKDILCNDQFDVLSRIVNKLKKIYKTLTYKHDEMKQYADLNQQVNFVNTIEKIYDCNELIEFDDQYMLSEEELGTSNSNFTSLKNSVCTRWNSLLVMIRSFVDNSVSINVALGYASKAELCIQNEELKILQSLKTFFEIFEQCTLVLQGQQYPTLSLNILFLNKILKR